MRKQKGKTSSNGFFRKPNKYPPRLEIPKSSFTFLKMFPTTARFQQHQGKNPSPFMEFIRTRSFAVPLLVLATCSTVGGLMLGAHKIWTDQAIRRRPSTSHVLGSS